MSSLIYVVEDEESIRELISASLSVAGFLVNGFSSSKEFYKALCVKLPELILLDIMLPEETGYEILKKIRKNVDYRKVPVIFLTAKSKEIDKVTGLDLGADDFIVKPFGVLELISRVNAVIRRYKMIENIITDDIITYKDLIIRTSEKALYKNDEIINLTFKEYELLMYLYKNRGITLSREKLLLSVWNYEFEGETRTVDSHIRSLRQKIGDNADDAFYIKTIRGYGYMLLKDKE